MGKGSPRGALAGVVGGKIAAEVVGEGIEAAGRIAAGALQGLGSAIGGAAQGLGSALGGALQGALTEGPKTFINNVGIAGQAGKAKVTGGGTLPAPKKAAKPAYNEKTPTEKLLAVAVGYLASIDASLRTQIENDRLTAQKQVQAEKEAAIEGKSGEGIFKTFGTKLGSTADAAKSKASDMVGTLLKGGLLIGGLGAIGISKLDTSELDALKVNIELFKKDYGWLSELSAVIAGASAGGKIAGPRGALVGAIGALALEYLISNTRFSEYLTGKDARPEAEKRKGLFGDSPLGDLSLAVGAKWLYGKAKYVGEWVGKTAKSGWKSLKSTAAWLWDSAFVRMVRTAAQNPKAWMKFLNWMERFGGKLGTEVAGRLAAWMLTQAATTTAEASLAATGIGAPVALVVTVVDKVIAGGFALWMLYDVYQLYKDYEAWSKANPEKVNGSKVPDANATPVAGETTSGATVLANPSTGIKSKSETGKPEEAQAFFESKGWTKDQAAGIVGNLFVESGLRTDAVGDGGKAYGIAQWHPDRQTKFRQVYGKDIHESSFQEQLEYVNWELNNTEKRAGYALRGASSAADAAAIVDSQYERSSGAAIAQRQANAMAVSGGDYANLQGGGGSDTEHFSAVSAMEMAKKIFGKAGGALIGAENYKPREITENVGAKISDISKNIEAVTIAGNEPEVAKAGEVAATAAQKSIMQASNDGSLTALDPNYPDGADTIMKYLAHWKFAA